MRAHARLSSLLFPGVGLCPSQAAKRGIPPPAIEIEICLSDHSNQSDRADALFIQQVFRVNNTCQNEQQGDRRTDVEASV
jgi:hypothetical protein